MAFSSKQRGVFLVMISGAAISLFLIAFGTLLNPFNFGSNLTLEAKFSVLFTSYSLLAICLTFAIARIAKHRFFSAQDIDGGGLSTGSERVVLLQSLLQNTLEQSFLATLVYAAWTILMPSTWLSVVPLAALTFFLGRVLFFIGYRRGAVGRALGFAMCFYPSIVMLILICFVNLTS